MARKYRNGRHCFEVKCCIDCKAYSYDADFTDFESKHKGHEMKWYEVSVRDRHWQNSTMPALYVLADKIQEWFDGAVPATSEQLEAQKGIFEALKEQERAV